MHYRPHAMVIDLGERVGAEHLAAGRRLVSTAEEISRGIPVITIGLANQCTSAVDSLKIKASDFVTRPFSAEDVLRRITVRTLAAAAGDPKATAQVKEQDSRADEGGLLPGEGSLMRHVLDQIRLVATRSATVLITGETGTGKERVAQALHTLSRRTRNDMVSVNCGGIPANLLEDEFFGHVRGAFTDAHQDRVGRFEQAENGTIFLDEIGDMPIELQPKLLRALQEREIHRVGDTEARKFHVRVIAATNVNLKQRVADGQFREDLYYRINVFPIHLPPLRERREDIPLFAAHFVDGFCRRDGLAPKDVSEGALENLAARRWPGNIRELENAMEMAVIQAQDRPTIAVCDLPEDASQSFATPRYDDSSAAPASDSQLPGSFKNLVSRFERNLILRTLEETHGNRSRAAECLGLKRTTLVEKLRKFDFEEHLLAVA
jgi:two-component system response regulator AtoC